MFWNDPDSKRYKSSYFEGFPGEFGNHNSRRTPADRSLGVWTHGDLIRINPETKGIYVLGRSDGVLNPSGVRFGTSDLYNILASPNLSSKIFDGLAVGQQRQTSRYSDPTERVVLFLKVAPDHSSGTLFPREELSKAVREHIIQDLSRRHVPHFFFEMDDIPHNANGKKMEIQVKQVCNGGQAALEKMTLTDMESDMLKRFVRFYDVEKVMKEQKRESKL